MNAIVNNLLFAGEKFMLEMHLKDPEFTYSACGPFSKNKERIKKIKETASSRWFIKMNKIKLVFNIMWLMEILQT